MHVRNNSFIKYFAYIHFGFVDHSYIEKRIEPRCCGEINAKKQQHNTTNTTRFRFNVKYDVTHTQHGAAVRLVYDFNEYRST